MRPPSLSIPGYERWEPVYQGRRNALYRLWRTDGNGTAVAKTPAVDPLGPYEAARIQYEYAVLSVLDVQGVVRPLALQFIGRRPVLVLEDAGSRSLLERLGGRPLPIPEFLDAAIELTETVAWVHERGFVHRDLCPENIVCDSELGWLTLVDFDRAMPLAAADTAGMPGEQFHGTIPYCSPEQVGRSGHAVDYRTDYYSLGATFYEMLTGGPPFAAADEAEYLRGQLTGRAVPPHQRNVQVPPLLSDIVLRLLAPNPEERYQRTEDILADLHRTRHQWSSNRDLSAAELQQTLERYLETAISIQAADCGSIHVANLPQGLLEIAAERNLPPELLASFRAVRVGEGLYGEALKNGGRMIIEDVLTAPGLASQGAREIFASCGIRALHSMPLVGRSGDLLGTVATYFRQPHRPSERDVALVRLIARRLSDSLTSSG